ncbi:MAG: BamA/TamA family outer membrane protein [Bacteroidota bacterium]
MSRVFMIFLMISFFRLPAQDSTEEKKVSILPLPVVFSTPETGLGFGALTSGVFNLGSPDDTRSSNIQVLGAYTVNNQIIAQVNNNVFTSSERYNVFGEVSYFNFPILYYGIGNDTQEESETELGSQVIVFQQRLLRQVKKGHFIGGQYRFINLFDVEFSPSAGLIEEDTTKIRSDEGIYSGLGFSYVQDTRDNVLNASKGKYLELSGTFHRDALGSDATFTRYRVDYRRFWTLDETSVFAAQLLGEFNNGEVPFRELALMGGDQIMRGYYQGRYRDKNQVAIQGEYRKQVKPWLGFTLFAATGEVGSSLDDIDIASFKWSAGGGLRLMVNRKERTNIRIDYGFGNGTTGLYFAFAEAF